MTTPIYNKVYDMYHEDEKGRIIANWTIGAMRIASSLVIPLPCQKILSYSGDFLVISDLFIIL
jgi:hypothetical protein